jgi:2-oxoglutarate dehydrogenase E1 component
MISRDRLPSNINIPFVEGLYAEFLQNPSSVSEEWRGYFQELARDDPFAKTPRMEPAFRPPSLFHAPGGVFKKNGAALDTGSAISLQDRVDQLLRAYRTRGHMIARIDPLDLPRPCPPELDPDFYGFTQEDMVREFSCETIHPEGHLPLAEIISRLRNTYCRTIGVEYMHIDDLAIRRWMQRRMEDTENRIQISRKDQIRILTRLTDAVTFEQFIRKKFVGAKSFSLEGSESLIPLLDLAFEKAGQEGIEQIVMGMAHRGRLNVLANILRKSARQIFREFADKDPEHYTGRGDVKYHLGHSSVWKTSTGRNIQISMCFNPSHLEFVNPVALGRMRAKQDRAGDVERTRGLTILIHGDAAFAGEGIVQETLNLSQLPAYTTGGTLHVIVNNQIGFTTAPSEARSSTYATDVAKMLPVPIFHVNGEDPEAVAQVLQICMDFRRQFHRDVFIDMYAYRRLGHNEGDEPSFTQPLLYRAISQRKPVLEGYLDHLLQMNEVTREEADEIAENRRAHLEKELSESQSDAYSRPPVNYLKGLWEGYTGGADARTPEVKTGVAAEHLASLLERQTQLPPDFHPHPKITKFLEQRCNMAGGAEPLDWSAAENLAFATLASEGYRVRLSGQDSRRGTFSHRHAVLHDYEDGKIHIPLQHLSPDQAPVEIYNSPLSEAAVLGFEYGYSHNWPDGLVMWEAQFGDFWNAAQVIVDQFIVSAEDKWHRLNGLVLLLPHGFEGQGPEHSSARLERFLALAAEDNIQVVYPTTPAQYFHCLRRQVIRPWRKPLVVMTPKSLLRHPQVISSLQECEQGRFQRILPDPRNPEGSAIRKVILCTGKIYYELEKQRAASKREEITLIRLEQLYPLNKEELQSALASFSDHTPVIWVQEEPENMGAWRYLRAGLGERLFGRFPFSVLSRPASASPATGSASSHKQEQAKLLAAALAKP